jgi:Family of unknown function (DUF6152)
MLSAAASAWMSVAPASAHHSTGLFDGHSLLKLSGTVVQFRWINPHASIVINGGTEDGRRGTWVVEMMAPTAMMDEGWRRDSLAVGDRVTVFAHPLRNPQAANVSQPVLYAGIVLANHRTMGHIDQPFN